MFGKQNTQYLVYKHVHLLSFASRLPDQNMQLQVEVERTIASCLAISQTLILSKYKQIMTYIELCISSQQT